MRHTPPNSQTTVPSDVKALAEVKPPPRPSPVERDREKCREMFLQRFLWLRDMWSDDLPTERVRPGSRYKCRSNFLQSLSGDLQLAAMAGLMAVDHNSPLSCVLGEFRSHQFNASIGVFTTADEIQLCNRLINLVVSHLRGEATTTAPNTPKT